MECCFFRDSDGREVDFVVTEDGLPLSFIECKWSDSQISKPLRYLRRKFPQAEHFQIHATGRKDYVSQEGIRVMPAHRYLPRFV